ncbi:LamB/YcsF family protein [Nakamurella sp. GG22]
MTAVNPLTVDINCDIGEGFGRWRMPNDNALMDIVTSVNVAAGFHAGDPTIMRATVNYAISRGLDIGAHVALPDLLGFGRREMSVTPAEVQDYCTYQIGAVAAFVTAAGGTLTHVKPHGALYSMASRDPEVAGAVAAATAEFGRGLCVFLLNDRCRPAVEDQGVELVTEGFPELNYADDGTLVLEREKAEWEPAVVAGRAVDMVLNHAVRTESGASLHVDVRTICIHSDARNAVQVAQQVITDLTNNNVLVARL